MTTFLAAANLLDSLNRPVRSIDLAVRAADEPAALELIAAFVRANELNVSTFHIEPYPHDPSVFNLSDDSPVDWLGR